MGKPRPRVRWYKDGHAVLDNSGESNTFQVANSEQETSNGAFNVLSTLKFVGPERLNADQLMPADRGHYTCQFENEVSSAETKMLLRIQHAPVVVHRHNKVAYNLGENAFISCRVQSFPEPSFQWTFKGSPLQSDGVHYAVNRTALPGDIYESTLAVFRVDQESYGDYTCRARNDIGPKKTKIRLQPKGKPEAPSNVRPVATGYNYVTLAWDEGFNGGFPETEYDIEYRRHGATSSPRYQDCHVGNTCNITGLEQHTQYHVRVRASNIMGISRNSPEAAVATKVDVSLIPKPANVHYERSTRRASFQVGGSPLALVAKVELENGDGTWSHYDGVALGRGGDEYAELDIVSSSRPVSNLRVRLCLESNELLCGPYTEALVVEVMPNARTSSSSLLGSPWALAAVAALALLALLALIVLVKCFCCRGKRAGAFSNQFRFKCSFYFILFMLPTSRIEVYNIRSNCNNSFCVSSFSTGGLGGKRLKNVSDVNTNGRPTIVHHPPPYTTNGGIDNKASEDNKDSANAAEDKSAGLFSAANVGYVGHQSSSNSNSANGGSVNSQVNLNFKQFPSFPKFKVVFRFKIGLFVEREERREPRRHRHHGPLNIYVKPGSLLPAAATTTAAAPAPLPERLRAL